MAEIHLPLRRHADAPATAWPCWPRCSSPRPPPSWRRGPSDPASVELAVDLGCGPGFTTRLLARAHGRPPHRRARGVERVRGPGPRGAAADPTRRVPCEADVTTTSPWPVPFPVRRPRSCSPATCWPTCPTPCARWSIGGSARWRRRVAGCWSRRSCPSTPTTPCSAATSSWSRPCRWPTATTCWSAPRSGIVRGRRDSRPGRPRRGGPHRSARSPPWPRLFGLNLARWRTDPWARADARSRRAGPPGRRPGRARRRPPADRRHQPGATASSPTSAD